METKPQPSETTIRLSQLWKEIPTIARVMAIGLTLVSVLVVRDFFRLVMEPGPLTPGEDLYIHIAMLILVPGATLGMYLISLGYAYYQICKRQKRAPFWKKFLDDMG